MPDEDAIYSPGYFETRLKFLPQRRVIWRHICRFLQRWIRPTDRVLELGAGWCDFSNQVNAALVVAMDIDGRGLAAAASHVRAELGDCTDLSRFSDGSFEIVFASNLLEHLQREQTRKLLREARRVLTPGGRLILVQPNFRLNPGAYFDDHTHVAIFTDRSIASLLAAEGWDIVRLMPRFLPLTIHAKSSRMTFLVPWYLRSPVKPFAGQMLVVASPSPRAMR